VNIGANAAAKSTSGEGAGGNGNPTDESLQALGEAANTCSVQFPLAALSPTAPLANPTPPE